MEPRRPFSYCEKSADTDDQCGRATVRRQQDILHLADLVVCGVIDALIANFADRDTGTWQARQSLGLRRRLRLRRIGLCCLSNDSLYGADFVKRCHWGLSIFFNVSFLVRLGHPFPRPDPHGTSSRRAQEQSKDGA